MHFMEDMKDKYDFPNRIKAPSPLFGATKPFVWSLQTKSLKLTNQTRKTAKQNFLNYLSF